MSGVHVVPVNDVVEHEYDDCVCGPDYQYIDPTTGEAYPGGPLVTHHSLDGREHHEPDARRDEA